MAYSYDDFLSAANASGMMGKISSYDMDLAQKYPEFGLSILSLKQDYGKASTDEQRLLINEAANQLRSSYGNYTGGQDGSQYISDGKIPGQIDNTLDQIGSFGSFDYGKEAPTYNNQYADTQQGLLDSILNRPEFSYSKESDPQWSSYKKSYLREGDRATSNALAQTSAATGGRVSSYAASAATQAGDYYATKLNDMIPQLYQQAYDKYLKEYQMKQSDLGMVNTQEQLDYQKHLDQMGQFNTDRNFSYNSYLNDYDRLNSYLGQLQGQDATDYSRYLDKADRRTEENRYQDSQKQLELDNAMNMFMTTGTVSEALAPLLGLPAGTTTAQMSQQQIQNAMNLLTMLGSATPEIAAKLGIGSGTKTADQEYNDWYRQFQEQQAAADRKQAAWNRQFQESQAAAKNGGEDGYGDGTESFADRFGAGDTSDEVIAGLLATGQYTQKSIEDAGYTGDYFSKNTSTGGGEPNYSVDEWFGHITNEVDKNRTAITVEDSRGNKRIISIENLASEIDSGHVVQEYDEKTGYYTYRLTSDINTGAGSGTGGGLRGPGVRKDMTLYQ